MAKPWYRYPPGFKAAAFERDGGHCRISLPGVCLHTPTCQGCARDLDHIIPASRGGAWFDLNNVRAACSPCNQARRRGMPPTPTRTPITPPERW
jgi:5-methylcytosine-specific restriction endonuclease McrA